MNISIHHRVIEFKSHIEYVIGFLNQHPLLPEGIQFLSNSGQANIHILYGMKTQSAKHLFFVPRQQLIFSKDFVYNDSISCSEYQSGEQSVYSIERKSKTATPFMEANVFSFDLIETIFFHISRYEEYHCHPNKQDKWGMMWEDQQILVQNGLHHIPVIDDLLLTFFNQLGIKQNDKATTFSLTHDIDVLEKFSSPYRIVRAALRSILDHGFKGLRNFLSILNDASLSTSKDPYDTFEFLLIDSSIDQFVHKVLFIMAGGKTKHDNYYQINDEKSLSIIESAKALGYKIGLHASYDSHIDPKQRYIESQNFATAIGFNPEYNRQHFLRFDFLRTPQLLQESTVRFDSTMGYQRLIGFRCGTGFPYKMFDFKKNRAYVWVEIPMVIMDGALLSEAGQDVDKAKQILDEFLDKNADNTHICFNVHNTIFDPTKRDSQKMKTLYKHMITRIEQNA